jgi:adenosylcobinamide kinase/adenosylcobinamide-phosphate guanylyltransferase
MPVLTKELILILGGARSGKSTYAQSLAGQMGGSVLYIATATAGDEEMAGRIAAHRANRPPGWQTLEAPTGLAEAFHKSGYQPAVAVLDCLTLLASNLLLTMPEPVSEADFQALIDAELDELLATWQAGTASWIIVSNEVGLGLVPPYPLGRVYRDVLGKANQRLAASATRVVFMVAGLPMVVK